MGAWVCHRFGRWRCGRSCRRLIDCVTEFGAQGLELDATLLAWGTDLQMKDGRWTDSRARHYRHGATVRDPFQLRVNAYRVLLTRGMKGCYVYFMDAETRKFVQSRIEKFEATARVHWTI